MSEYTQSEFPAIQLLQKLGYEYLNAQKEMDDVVLKEQLEISLMRLNLCLNENNLRKVIKKIEAVNGSSLMEINAEIHHPITRADTLTLKSTPDEHPISVKFIAFTGTHLSTKRANRYLESFRR